jgi:hypothetical protein
MNDPIQEELRGGRIRLQEHWLNQAEESLRRVLASDPENVSALHWLGITAFKLGFHDDGIALIRRALDHNPGRTAAWFDLAVAMRDAGRPADAQAAYDAGNEILAKEGPGRAAPLADQVFSVERGTHEFTMVEYDYTARIRYGSRTPHPQLSELLHKKRDDYAAFIDSMGALREDFNAIATEGSYSNITPFWLNTWFAPLDAMALQTMLWRHRPKLFVEIGSGMSTKFAHHTVEKRALKTRMVSVDPQPRNQIDRLVDRTVRAPLESVNLENFNYLRADDILFLDSSHRSFQNSDVTVFFLDILPRLAPGVIVHVHDIYLPYDYPAGHLGRLWNEQYLLATALLFGSNAFEVLFPSWYVSQEKELSAQIARKFRTGQFSGVSLHGVSFWMRKI